jgi:hypothetical protein
VCSSDLGAELLIGGIEEDAADLLADGSAAGFHRFQDGLAFAP